MCNGITGILDQKDGQVRVWTLSSRTCSLHLKQSTLGAVTGMAFGGTDSLWPQSHLSQGIHWAFPPAPVIKISSVEPGLLSHLYEAHREVGVEAQELISQAPCPWPLWGPSSCPSPVKSVKNNWLKACSALPASMLCAHWGSKSKSSFKELGIQ